jgi:NAD-dependent SIR2 family protein deacetylase
LASDALRGGAVVVEINPSETPLSRGADYALRGPAGEVLPELVKSVYG